jgi:hypothetical protein
MNVIRHHDKGVDEISIAIEKQQAVSDYACVVWVAESTAAQALIHPIFKLC